MGCDISPIGNHQLNTKNIKTLVEDIVSRIDINLEYGYYGQKEYFNLLGEQESNDKFVMLGNIVKDPNFKNFRLYDENYQLKQLHEKFGDEIFYNPAYWIFCSGNLPDNEDIEYEKKKLIYGTYTMSSLNEEDRGYLTIHNELFCNDIPYFSRWWGLCEFFDDCLYTINDYMDSFTEFRKELMYYSTHFGGNKVYYLNDQSSVLEGVGQGSEWDMDWKTFENFIIDKTENLMLDIPRFMTDTTYKNDFFKKNEYPLSFIDNFSDLS